MYASPPHMIICPANPRWLLHGTESQADGTADQKDGLPLAALRCNCCPHREYLDKRYIEKHDCHIIRHIEIVLDKGFQDTGVVYFPCDSSHVLESSIKIISWGKPALLFTSTGPSEQGHPRTGRPPRGTCTARLPPFCTRP